MKLLPKDYEYRRTSNSVSSINYHFVFVPKRRKAVLVVGVAQRLQEIILELINEHGWHVIALDIMPSRYLFINAPTHESAADIARWIKGRASHHSPARIPPTQETSRSVDSNLLRGDNGWGKHGDGEKIHRESER